MRIAIPSNDKIHITAHFGRTKGFNVYEIENQQIKTQVYRSNTFTHHQQHRHVEHQSHGNGHGEHRHSHGAILDALNDVSVVIAGGMGRRLYDDLRAAKIETFVTRHTIAEAAVMDYLKGEIDNNEDGCCQH